MSKKYYDPLLDTYFSKEEVKDFKSKGAIKDLFKGKENKPVLSSDIKADLGNKRNYQKVLVGTHDSTPFYALVDRSQGICIPLIEQSNAY